MLAKTTNFQPVSAATEITNTKSAVIRPRFRNRDLPVRLRFAPVSHRHLGCALTERAVRSDTAMTGEISPRGLVLPVGGNKETLAVAARAGLRRVLLPARNRKDLEEIGEETRKQLELVWLERVKDAIEAALEPVAP